MSGTEKEWEWFRQSVCETVDLLMEKYEPDDMFVTLYYDRDHKPKDEEEARKETDRFFDRLGEICWARRTKTNSICYTEYFSDRPWKQSPDLHHHVIIDTGVWFQDAVISAWKAGRVKIDTLLNDTIDSYELRALTMVKEYAPSRKEERAWID